MMCCILNSLCALARNSIKATRAKSCFLLIPCALSTSNKLTSCFEVAQFGFVNQRATLDFTDSHAAKCRLSF